MSQSATSHQLRILRNLNLVRTRKEGRVVFYTLDDDHIRELFQRGLEHIQHEEKSETRSRALFSAPEGVKNAKEFIK